MMRALLLALLLSGCASTAPVICSIPPPPADLLTVPPALRSVPVDIKVKQ